MTWLIEELSAAGARQAGLKYLQGIGLWLPSGPSDFAVPDLSLVEADYRDAHVEKNCFAPHAFRMVLEVTSSNWSDDLGTKVDCYAQAGIPVYLVADRRHDEVVLHTDPRNGAYRSRKPFKRGTSAPSPNPPASHSNCRWTASSTATRTEPLPGHVTFRHTFE
ncbi:Uma2 family endonuclease [Streptomyces sp. MS1.HAVA.3]|uniref:Uma2 family endonuclease n=1 Tax=Streptomyces caledonius TaxID=3134107 RepID=A0ABU8U588_9ACTN